MTSGEYGKYPEQIFIRHLRYRVEQKGFRTQEVTLATTLIDASRYDPNDGIGCCN